MIRRVNPRVLLAVVSGAIVLEAFASCADESTPAARATLEVEVSSNTVVADGRQGSVTVIASEPNGDPGAGSVSLKVTKGSLGQETLTLDEGFATAKWSCNAASNSECLGIQLVTASWNGVKKSAKVEFISDSETPGMDAGSSDAGPSDAETAAGEDDGGEQDAGEQADASLPPTQLFWVSTQCGGTDCVSLGFKGQGFNDVATVTFAVTDALNNPVAGIAVTFTIENPPDGLTFSPTSQTTDINGRAFTVVSAGRKPGSFAVAAEVAVPTHLQAMSRSVGVHDIFPSNHGFTLACSPVNLAAFVTNHPGVAAPLTATCVAKLVDSENNAIATETSVCFTSEAGSIQGTDSPGCKRVNAEDGTATVTFSTEGSFKLADADLAVGEPPYGSHHPRDGLVTIIAWGIGQEYFVDDNGNGVWDEGEYLVDQGSPFVDANDNGHWGEGEFCRHINTSGECDPPNGVWDQSAEIWTETRILYTGIPVTQEVSIDRFSDDCGTMPPFEIGPPLARRGTEKIGFYFRDFNGNRVQAAGTSISVSQSATRGNLSIELPNVLNNDNYGFEIKRELFAATDTSVPCSETGTCVWKMSYGNWGDGYSGLVEILNDAEATEDLECQDTTITVKLSGGPGDEACWAATVETTGAYQ
jgi:hypothetical protein